MGGSTDPYPRYQTTSSLDFIEGLMSHVLELLPHLSEVQVMRQWARSRLMVLSSRMEGGANVGGESISVGTPVVSTRISGSICLLGEDYPGFFEPGDVSGLRRLLLEAESEHEFYHALSVRCAGLRSVFEPRRERRAWERLLEELSPGG